MTNLPSFFETLDGDTAAARQRLVAELIALSDRGDGARAILGLANSETLIRTAGREPGRLAVAIAADAYLRIARTERVSLFSETCRTPPEDVGAVISAGLDDLALRLARAGEAARLFGLIFAIERARHLLFVTHPEAFALEHRFGPRAAMAGTLHPALTHRLAALVNAVGAMSGDRPLVLVQAHAAYGVIERMVRAIRAIDPPARAHIRPGARRHGGKTS